MARATKPLISSTKGRRQTSRRGCGFIKRIKFQMARGKGKQEDDCL